MSRTGAFLMVSLPLYVVLALLSFRGVHFDVPLAEGAQAIYAHEYDYPLLWAYAAVCGVLFVAYFWSLWRFDEMRLDRRTVLSIGAVFGLVAWAAFPGVYSNDVMAYVGYGRLMAVHHVNPWVHSYQGFDDFYQSYAWYPYPMPYGPLVAPFLAAAGALSERSVPLAYYFLKLCWLCVHLGSGLVVWQIARSLRIDAAKATWAFLCNPLLLLELVNNGHCDGLLVLLSLLSVRFLLRSEKEGDALLALLFGLLAMLVKPTALLLLSVEAVWLLRRGQLRPLAIIAMVAGGLALILAETLFASPAAREALTNPHILTNAYSFHSVFLHYFWQNYLVVYETDPLRSVRTTVAVFFALFCLWRLSQVRDGRDVIREYLLMTLGLMLFYSARVWPWYMAWLVPFAALSESRVLRHGILLWSMTMLADYAVPFRMLWTSFPWHVVRVVVANGIPLVWMGAEMAWSRPGSPLPAEGRVASNIRAAEDFGAPNVRHEEAFTAPPQAGI